MNWLGLNPGQMLTCGTESDAIPCLVPSLTLISCEAAEKFSFKITITQIFDAPELHASMTMTIAVSENSLLCGQSWQWWSRTSKYFLYTMALDEKTLPLESRHMQFFMSLEPLVNVKTKPNQNVHACMFQLIWHEIVLVVNQFSEFVGTLISPSAPAVAKLPLASKSRENTGSLLCHTICKTFTFIPNFASWSLFLLMLAVHRHAFRYLMPCSWSGKECAAKNCINV